MQSERIILHVLTTLHRHTYNDAFCCLDIYEGGWWWCRWHGESTRGNLRGGGIGDVKHRRKKSPVVRPSACISTLIYVGKRGGKSKHSRDHKSCIIYVCEHPHWVNSPYEQSILANSVSPYSNRKHCIPKLSIYQGVNVCLSMHSDHSKLSLHTTTHRAPRVIYWVTTSTHTGLL